MSGPSEEARREEWRQCIAHPEKCGEWWRGYQLDAGPAEEEGAEEEAEEKEQGNEARPREAPPAAPQVVVRHKGRLRSTYWTVLDVPYAHRGDVVVVHGNSWYVLRPAKKPATWMEAPEELYIEGEHDKPLCAYGFVLQRDLERVAEALRSGRYALVATCARLKLKPPRNEDLYNIWRYEGYQINASPALMTLILLKPGAKRRFAVDWLKKGCAVYSHAVNEMLNSLSLPPRLLCH